MIKGTLRRPEVLVHKNDLEIISDIPHDETEWNSVRNQAAIVAMSVWGNRLEPDACARKAVEYADKLVETLKRSYGRQTEPDKE